VIIDTVDEVDLDDEIDSEFEQTQAEIEQTRAQMSETLEAIKEKLNPQMLMEQAKETVHGVTADLAQQAKETVHAVTSDVVQQARENLPEVSANVAHQAVQGAVAEAKEAMGSAVSRAKEAVGGAVGTAKEAVSGAVDTAREAVSGAVGTARQTVGGAVDTAKDAGSSVVQTIEQNPLPTALIAMGIGWFWMNTWRQNGASRASEQTYRFADEGWSDAPRAGGTPVSGSSAVGQTLQQAKQKVGAVADQLQEQAGQLGTQVQDRAVKAADGFQQLLHQHPLAVGAMAMTAGAAFGLLMPPTRQERQLMGEARDRLADKVQQTAHEVGLKAQIVAEEALDTVKEEAKNQGLTK